MAISRRAFVRSLGAGAAVGAVADALPGSWVSARGREALAAFSSAAPSTIPTLDVPSAMRLNSNENPNGPSSRALEAIRRALGEANRYPFQATDQVAAAIARHHGVALDNIRLGCGSTELLQSVPEAFTGPGRALVTAAPTYETPSGIAADLGADVRAVPVDSSLRLDLAAMRAQAHGAGLVYFCNPNNPTATVHGRAAVADFVDAVTRASGTTVLIDEAYFEFVDDPSYATAIPLAMDNPRVIVLRTFSKIHGMAGMRLGYAVAQAQTLAKLRRFKWQIGINVLAIAAGLASIGDTAHVARQQALNRTAKAFTIRALRDMGVKVGDSQTNFIMVDVRRDVRAFADACLERGILVGRPFPPLMSQARISIGTLEEMHRAVEVFRAVLGASTAAALHG